MMEDNEGFLPEAYGDYHNMIEYITARDNGFEGDYVEFCQMQRCSDEFSLRVSVRALRRRGLTEKQILALVEEEFL